MILIRGTLSKTLHDDYSLFTRQVHCARQLLFRGIDKTIRNKAGQTAYEVAALTSNFVIMDDITNFKPEQAGLLLHLNEHRDHLSCGGEACNNHPISIISNITDYSMIRL